MDTTQIIVTLVGFGIIGWIVWYFWLWKGEAVAAQAGAGGVQVVDVTVRGGYQPASIVAEAGRPLRLNFTRRESTPCGEEVVLPDSGGGLTCRRIGPSPSRSRRVSRASTSSRAG